MKIKESSRSSRKFNQAEKFKCPEYNQNCLGMQEVGKSESEKKINKNRPQNEGDDEINI